MGRDVYKYHWGIAHWTGDLGYLLLFLRLKQSTPAFHFASQILCRRVIYPLFLHGCLYYYSQGRMPGMHANQLLRWENLFICILFPILPASHPSFSSTLSSLSAITFTGSGRKHKSDERRLSCVAGKVNLLEKLRKAREYDGWYNGKGTPSRRILNI